MALTPLPPGEWDSWFWAPPVSALTLYARWTSGSTAELRDAMGRLLAANPPLGGKLERADDGSIGIRCGAHTAADLVRFAAGSEEYGESGRAAGLTG